MNPRLAGGGARGLGLSPKDLPSIDRLLHLPGVVPLVERHGHTLAADQARRGARWWSRAANRARSAAPSACPM